MGHILRRIGGEVGNQFVVDRQVWGEHEEIANALLLMQLGDERAHEPRFAHAGGQGEAE